MNRMEEMVKVSDVAAALIERAGALTTFQLMKLTYYVQAWHAATYGRPLFDSRIEAWANGPVSPVLWSYYRKMGLVRTPVVGDSTRLTPEASVLVDLVIQHYGHLNGDELSGITHTEKPWLLARGDRPEGTNGNDAITMAEYYFDKSLAGHSPLELAVVGANPQTRGDDETIETFNSVLARFVNTKIDSFVEEDSEYVRYVSGFDQTNYEELTTAPKSPARS
jgi:uncharacterized phage-associated protein